MNNLRDPHLLWMILVAIQSSMIRCEDSSYGPPTSSSWTSASSSMGGGCQSFVCQNYGTCYSFGSSIADVFCACDWPFTGRFCETTIYEADCQSTVCQNGGTCHNFETSSVSGVFCDCGLQFTGEFCETSVYEADCQSTVCQNGGTCHNFETSSVSGVFCDCGLQFTGEFCETSVDDVCASYPCHNGGSCITQTADPDTPYCKCMSGWTGTYCENNDAGTGCSCYVCQNGGTCYDIGEGETSETYCVCPWMYTGGFCEIVINSDSCAGDLSPCENGGTCIPDENSGYLCACPTGLTGNLCQESSDNDGCSSGVCQNGGTCYFIGAEDNTHCLCPWLYTGDACETTIELYNCDITNPCDNGGSCYPTGATYVCVCTQEWTGDNCQVNYDSETCDTSPPCGPDGNGACVVKDGSTRCMCYNGWAGEDCETRVEPDGTTGESTNIPIIAGAAGGSIFLLLLVGCFVYCVVSKRNKQRREPTAPTIGPRPYPMNAQQGQPKFIDPNPPPYYVAPPDVRYHPSATLPEYQITMASVSKPQGASQSPAKATAKPAKPPLKPATSRSPREEYAYSNNIYEEIPEPAAMVDGEDYMVPSAQRDVNQNANGQGEYVEVIS